MEIAHATGQRGPRLEDHRHSWPKMLLARRWWADRSWCSPACAVSFTFSQIFRPWLYKVFSRVRQCAGFPGFARSRQ